MGFFNLDANKDYLMRSSGTNDPALEAPKPGWFQGTFLGPSAGLGGEESYNFGGPGENWMGAVPKGAASGAFSVVRAFGASEKRRRMQEIEAGMASPDPETRAAYRQMMQEFKTSPDPVDESLQQMIQYSKTDPRTTGAVANFLGQTTRGFTIAAAGSALGAGNPYVTAGTMAAAETVNTQTDLELQGVDPTTASRVAGLTGGLAGAGVFIPGQLQSRVAMRIVGMSLEARLAGNTLLANTLAGLARGTNLVAGSTAGRMGFGAAVNVGQGIVGRYTSGAVLEASGYKEMAEQYKVLDAEAIAADIVLGAAFGLHGGEDAEGMHRRMDSEAEMSRPTQDMIEQAHAARRDEMIARGAAGIPADPVAAALDERLQTRAVEQALRGQDMYVSPEEARTITEGAILDPERLDIQERYEQAYKEHIGDLANEVELLPEPPEPDVIRPVQVEGEAAVRGSVADEHLAQVAARYPDLDVTTPDGRTVKASELRGVLDEQMQTETKKAGLFDVAVACFLGAR